MLHTHREKQRARRQVNQGMVFGKNIQGREKPSLMDLVKRKGQKSQQTIDSGEQRFSGKHKPRREQNHGAGAHGCTFPGTVRRPRTVRREVASGLFRSSSATFWY